MSDQTEARQPVATPNVVTGIGVILLGVALLLERLGVIEARALLQLWPLLLILLGIHLVVQAIWSQRHQVKVGESSTGGLWVIIVIVALLAWQAQRRADFPDGVTDASAMTLLAVMGQDRRTSQAADFRRADMTTVMGQTRLDLSDARAAPGAPAVVDVFTVMGSAVVHVPRDWVVEIQAVPVMGRVRDARLRSTNPGDTDAERERDVEQERGDVATAAGDSSPRTARRAARAEERERARAETVRPSTTLQPLEPGADETAPVPRLVVRGFVLFGEIIIRS